MRDVCHMGVIDGRKYGQVKDNCTRIMRCGGVKGYWGIMCGRLRVSVSRWGLEREVGSFDEVGEIFKEGVWKQILGEWEG